MYIHIIHIYTYIHIYIFSFAEVVLELNYFHLFAFTETKVGKSKGREVRRYSPFLWGLLILWCVGGFD